MYKTIVLCLLFFMQNNDKVVISWRDNYRLTWHDFKAKPKHSVNAVATTASGITFGFSVRESDKHVISFTTEVNAHFYPEQSWYKPERANKHVLGHEQLHFDITELYARKFRKRISLLKTTNDVTSRLRAIHKIINEELAAYQNKYDTETDFSRNIPVQQQWEAFIKTELKTLDHFKSKN